MLADPISHLPPAEREEKERRERERIMRILTLDDEQRNAKPKGGGEVQSEIIEKDDNSSPLETIPPARTVKIFDISLTAQMAEW